MNTLPRDKRNGEPLLLIEEPHCSLVNPLLTPDAESKVERVILEYSNRQKLRIMVTNQRLSCCYGDRLDVERLSLRIG